MRISMAELESELIIEVRRPSASHSKVAQITFAAKCGCTHRAGSRRQGRVVSLERCGWSSAQCCGQTSDVKGRALNEGVTTAGLNDGTVGQRTALQQRRATEANDGRAERRCDVHGRYDGRASRVTHDPTNGATGKVAVLCKILCKQALDLYKNSEAILVISDNKIGLHKSVLVYYGVNVYVLYFRCKHIKK